MSEFREVVAVATGEKQTVPIHWLEDGSPFADQFTQAPSDKQLEERSETPDTTWTAKQLRAHAEQVGIDLAGASTKADILSALNAPKSGEED
jgi:hypothetical protein